MRFHFKQQSIYIIHYTNISIFNESVKKRKDITLKKYFFSFLILLSITLTSCLQDDDSDFRIPVSYTVIVSDYATGNPIENAKVELTNENQFVQPLYTNSTGKVVFPSEESYVNQIIVSKKDYFSVDTIDIISNPDTTLKIILRSINVFLIPVNTTDSTM